MVRRPSPDTIHLRVHRSFSVWLVNEAHAKRLSVPAYTERWAEWLGAEQLKRRAESVDPKQLTLPIPT